MRFPLLLFLLEDQLFLLRALAAHRPEASLADVLLVQEIVFFVAKKAVREDSSHYLVLTHNNKSMSMGSGDDWFEYLNSF